MIVAWLIQSAWQNARSQIPTIVDDIHGRSHKLEQETNMARLKSISGSFVLKDRHLIQAIVPSAKYANYIHDNDIT